MNGPGRRGDQSDEVLPRDWAALAPLVDRVLDAAPEARAALLEELAAEDPDRRRALEHLVAECERDVPLLNRGAAERFDSLAREPDASLLPELLADRYRTGRELGRGGMARVYLARDSKHGREVAIKVIRAELSASLGHGRFLREIEIAARLRHPNIVPLYDSGEVGGSLYFVMPYEEGRSLRQRLQAEGALPIADALSVLRDVARALAYAHDHGVVHRDVKPDNVMLSGDAAVVTDFGIAKAVSAALTGGAGPTLTQAGSGIGTPAYMAPEQAMGDPGTDHRADIYSFGCLAYEVFTGTTPFPEPTSHQVMAAHLSRVPRPVTELRAEVPANIAHLIAQCLAKLPDERPQQVREILGVLDGTTTISGVRPSPTAPRSVRGSAVRWGAVAVALTLLAFAGYRATRAAVPATATPIKVSVLPFGNIASDTAAVFLTDGLPEEIANALGRVPGIQIQSRSGARAYTGQLSVDVTEAGLKLGADYVMTAVVRRDGGNWILSAEFSRASDGASLWGENFTISPNQQTRTIETITSNLLAALRRQFPNSIGNAPLVASASQTKSGLANEFYLGGQAKLRRRQMSVNEAAGLFRQAIKEDSAFAPAWSGLSLALAFYPYFERVPARSVYEEVLGAAARSLELDSTLAEPHVALGLAYENNREWKSAEAAFQKALTLEPDHVEARIQYGRFLKANGRTREALGELETARRADPQSAVILSNMAYAYLILGRLDSARVLIDLARQSEKENLPTISIGIRIHLSEGRVAEARALAATVLSSESPFGNYVLVKTGDTATAMARLRATDRELTRAYTMLALNDTAQALGALARATDAGEIFFMTEPLSSPTWDPVRGSARFADIVRQLRLPPSAAARPGARGR